MDCRLIFDRPAPGTWNMAMDEALLLSVGRAGQGGVLRFYQWSEPTVSLGYFQRYADRHSHAASRHCPLVRRSTGGGAIVHDHELTYCFVVAAASHVSAALERYYDAFHETLVDQLAAWHVDARRCTAGPRVSPADAPFLCFQRHTRGDVLLADCKIAGSAQRRHRGAVLQHGSILLSRSEASPELAGIEQLSRAQIDPWYLAEKWGDRIAKRLDMVLLEGNISNEEVKLAKEICTRRYSTGQWTCRR